MRRTVLAFLLLLLSSPLEAQQVDTTGILTPRQLRQRAGFALAQVDNILDPVAVMRQHIAFLQDQFNRLVVRDSLRALGPVVPPPPTPTPPPLQQDTWTPAVGALASHSYEDGTLGPFPYAWAAEHPAGAAVISDPTSRAQGKVLRLRYTRSTTTQSQDVNRAVFYDIPNGQRYGETIIAEGQFYIPTPSAAPNAMRKLLYWQRGDANTDFAVLKLHGTALAFEGGAVGSTFWKYSLATLPFDRWHKVRTAVTVNTGPGVRDGRLQVWANDTLRYDTAGVMFINTSGTAPYFAKVGVGYQTQADVTYDEVRYWDRIQFLRGTTIFPPTPTSGLLWEDDFETTGIGTQSKVVNGIHVWGASNRTAVTEMIARSGTRALQFTYAGDPNLCKDQQAEQRFKITERVQHVYIEYYFYVSNGQDGLGAKQYHRIPYCPENQDPNGVGNNNKWLLVWDSIYSPKHVLAGFEYRVSQRSTQSGDSRIYTLWGNDTRAAGPWNHPTGSADPFLVDSLRGRWVQIRIAVDLATTKAAADGRVRLWVNGVLYINAGGLDLAPEPGGRHYLENGYIFGWSNAGFNETTFYFVDDFKIWKLPPEWAR